MSAASTLQFDLKPSLKLAGLLLAAHVLAPAARWVSLGGWASWRDRNGGWHEGKLRSDHFVSAALVVLGLDQTGHGHKWLVLMGDSALPEDFRRLRVWLRWRRDVGSGGSPTRASTE